MAAGSGSPCGACKFLRRKCAADCIFAPYFGSEEQGPSRFAAIHKIFGASNVSKLLLHVPVADRYEAVVTISYEAQARLRDPVYGCVSHIFQLQQQVALLQAQVMQVKAQLAAQSRLNSRQLIMAAGGDAYHQQLINRVPYCSGGEISPQASSIHSTGFSSSLDHLEQMMVDTNYMNKDDYCFDQPCIKRSRVVSQNEFVELQDLALKMMRN